MQPVVVETQDDLRKLIRDRIAEVNTTYTAVEALSGLTEGHLAKLLAPARFRKFGAQSLPLVLHALALKIARIELIEDPAVAAKMRLRWTQRRRRRSPEQAVQQCIVACSEQGDLFGGNPEEASEWPKTND